MSTLNYRPMAAELCSALQSLSVNAIVELFTKVGYATHGRYIFSHPDAPLPNAVLVIDLNSPIIDPEKIAQDFHKLKITVNDAELEWLLVLQSAELTYFKRSKKIAEIPLTLGSSNTQARKQSHKKMGSSSLTAKRDKNQETTLDMLASVITVISPRVMHSAESLVLMYGEHSILFSYAIDRLGTLFRDQKDSTLEDVFAKWQGEFDAIYRKGDATEELFLRHAYLALLLCLVLGAAFFPQETLNEQPIAGLINLLEEQWLQPIFECNWFGWALADAELTGILRRGIIPFQSSKQGEFTQSFEAGDLFRLIYPQMVAPTARLALGEFYTPPELAQMMVGDAYTFGQVVLDPACGSGTFLSEIYRKIMDNPDQSVAAQTNACSNVIGFDVNPIAVATARVNALVQLKSLIQAEPSVRLFIDLLDSLFPENDSKGRTSELFNKCDLVIGNPPWVVLNSIHRADYKEQIKALARQWGIGLGAKQMSNLEISALFLYGAKRYLKDGGRVSFIVSNAFLSGDNHATTRQFLEFDEIHVWKFTRDVFHIHNVCLSAIFRPGFTRSTEDLSQLKVHALIFEPIVHEDSEISFNYLKEDILIPYAVVPKKATTKKNIPKSETGSGNLVKKLVSQAELTTLLPMGWNAYETLCNKGATLIPRNLVFVRIEPGGNDFCDIAVVIQNPKSPWDFDPIFRLYPESGTTTVQVEKSFVFPVLKSDSVLPFVALPPDHAFLPIDTDEGSSGYALTTRHDTRGWAYFEALNELYISAQKEGAAVHGLWDNLNYLGKLTPPRQRKPVKVVMMGTGTIIKACIVQDPSIIIDYSNFFVGLDDLEEAYFLCGFLNAPAVTQTVRVIIDEGAAGSGRNIMKRPFSIRLPRYDVENELHQEIVKMALNMERHARKILDRWITGEEEKLKLKDKGENSELDAIFNKISLKKLALQNRIYKELGWDTKKSAITGEFAQLNQLIREVISRKGK